MENVSQFSELKLISSAGQCMWLKQTGIVTGEVAGQRFSMVFRDGTVILKPYGDVVM